MRLIWSPSGRQYREATPPNWFYISNLEYNNTSNVSIKKMDAAAPTLNVEMSFDGVAWSTMGTTSTTPITATIPADGKLYLRCLADSWGNDANGLSYNTISIDGRNSLFGNIMSLLYGRYFTGEETMFPNPSATHIFSHLFYQCYGLQDVYCTFPALVALPYCYESIFEGCTWMEVAPSIFPAMTLAEYCYLNAFAGCEYIAYGTKLPAINLAKGCYQFMYFNSSLEAPPTLNAKTLVNSCYWGMFSGCQFLDKITCLAEDITAPNCTYLFTNGVSANGTFYKSPNMNNWTVGVDGIPSGWSVQNV